MKAILVFLCVIFTVSVASQESFTEIDARKIVDTFFEGFHEGDTSKMRTVLADHVIMQTAYTTGKGEHKLNESTVQNILDAIAARPADQQWNERLLDYSIRLDGNLAHVWTPYEFWVNGTFSHCGANAFTLARTPEGWKIVHLIDSRRKASCKSGG